LRAISLQRAEPASRIPCRTSLSNGRRRWSGTKLDKIAFHGINLSMASLLGRRCASLPIYLGGSLFSTPLVQTLVQTSAFPPWQQHSSLPVELHREVVALASAGCAPLTSPGPSVGSPPHPGCRVPGSISTWLRGLTSLCRTIVRIC